MPSLPDETNRYLSGVPNKSHLQYTILQYIVRGMLVIFRLVLAMLKLNLHYVGTPNIKLHFDRGLSRSATDKNNRTPSLELCHEIL